ncbi:hypothetical protein AAHW96_18790 [Klebsiella quasipneumoniae subsp. similipneumoniae]|uniref:hypothetical protein n=1 Tax=Klebsiella pneumoniae complex TaxID=3390273 RepID=UPI000E2C2113|nr:MULTISPECIES: hypothetical protein [Klebsiella]HBS3673859.1 hypothetical protein [Klebsiella quasipneumoniae subsp. similipneumoniae]HDS4004244.1 hypothetical protein [Klebsiella pneumoniae subsp. pneumoniae]HDU4481849.1 hypothetical protein [Klebsiella pneumoniae subsp. ozaenae]AYY23392.1 hypothetical protein EGY03_20395 [Klebsiella pneumoniae]KAB0318927.1 hypothetical protein FPQ47_21600 [Klebsiella pneumoniae]
MIRIGRLLPGGIAIDEGQHHPIKGVALLIKENSESEEIVVFAKEISSRSISIEITCAALGRALSLPIPEPVLLFDSSNKAFFGSVDATYPSFMKYVSNSSDQAVSDALASWPLLKKASYFDEWIAMDDRHNGNLLFNGDGFFLIDHESAIPQGLAPDLFGIDYYSNQLLQVATYILDRSNDIAVQMMANEARAWTMSCKSNTLTLLDGEISETVQGKEKNQIMSFLSSRIELLGDILYDQIKPQQTQMIYDAKS